ncbi:MAG TPA: DUF3857 domain-containing protein [Salinimicrobium sp.]|nr:DUF3857 domain-containing protein [Salinimicrobium sp.]
MLNNETRISIDKRGEKTTERTILIQINEKQDDWLSHIEIRHNPRQDFSFEYARILDLQGNVLRKIKRRDLITRSVSSYQAFYQDDLVSEFDLYWHQYPYRIEYSYTIEEEEFLYVSWWTPLLYSDVPTVRATLEIETPDDYSINVSQSGNIIFSESVTEDGKQYLWMASSAGEIDNEIYSPPIRELIPRVSVVPSGFKYGVEGSTESWSSFGSWLNNLNHGTDVLPQNELRILERLLEDTQDKREIIQKLYYYLQDHTRYINVAIDVGGMKSYPASYVCKNKYGDCKALTTYMKAMLKSQGISSYYTVINAGKAEGGINEDFPSQQFNHVVLAVPLENDTIWLENTSNSLPFDYLGTFTQDRYALLVNEGNSRLVKTPKLLPSDVLVQRDYQFNVDQENLLGSDITLELRGAAFEVFRHLLTDQDQEKIKARVNSNIGIDGFNIISWNSVGFNRDSSNVKIHVLGNISGFIREIGDWKVINPLNIVVPEFELPERRDLELRINYPIHKSDRAVFNFKSLQDREVQIPEGIFIENDYGRYQTSFTKEGNSIVASETFLLLGNKIPLTEYPKFYSFIQTILDHKKKSSILIK